MHRGRVQLIKEEVVLWTMNPSVTSLKGIVDFPFSFKLPDGPGSPPSFVGGSGIHGGSVNYYIHAVAERKAWYKRNVTVNQGFAFLPHDYTPAPYLILPNWPGEWESFKESEKMRRGILSHHGLVEVEVGSPCWLVIRLFSLPR
jgi:hypothetical protein